MKRPRMVSSTIASLLLFTLPFLVAPLITGATPSVREGVEDFIFESFDADYTLDLDSEGRATMRVVETIVAVFPPNQNRGIIRAIPTHDGEVPLAVSMASITDQNGDPWYYERNDRDGFAEFSLGTDDFLSGRTTFVLEYTVRDPIRYFTDVGVDEFYWDLNGNGWAQPFGTVSGHIEFGPQLAAALTGQAACYTGYYGGGDRCDLTKVGGGFDVSVADISPHSTVTVSIGLDGGTVVQPPLPRDSWIVQLAPKFLLGMLVALLVISILLRTLGWRDAPGRGIVIPQYSPPEGSDLLIDANVVRRPKSGLPALFVDLAVRGMIKVVDHLPGEPRVSGRLRFSLQLITDEGATPRERAILVAMFGPSLRPGKDVRPGYFGAQVGPVLFALTSSAASVAIKQGYRFRRMSRWPRIITRVSLVTVVLFIPVGVWAAINGVFDDAVVWPAIGAIVIAIAIPNVLIVPARLTRKGAALRDHLLGMRVYLTVAEEERIRMLQSPDGAERVDITDQQARVKLYERLLPYAVLWGVEDQWVEKLQAEYGTATPDWLEGTTLTSSMFSSFAATSTASVRPIVSSSSGGGSSWSSSGGSSSSSGSSGGGFSGGGGGGGGGGGR